jgi:hypothetical protein
VSQIGFTNNGAWRMTTTKAYDSLNRLTEISSAPSGDALVSFSYSYNLANQRTLRREADGSWARSSVVSWSATAFCGVKPQRGDMVVAPEPPHPLLFCFSAARRHPRAENASGLAQSRTPARWPGALEGREASWSAAVPCRFSPAAGREGGDLNATGPVTVLVYPVSPLQGLGLFCTLTQGDARLGTRFALG